MAADRHHAGSHPGAGGMRRGADPHFYADTRADGHPNADTSANPDTNRHAYAATDVHSISNPDDTTHAETNRHAYAATDLHAATDVHSISNPDDTAHAETNRHAYADTSAVHGANGDESHRDNPCGAVGILGPFAFRGVLVPIHREANRYVWKRGYGVPRPAVKGGVKTYQRGC